MGPISLGTDFPLVSQQGIGSLSVIGPYPSINEAPAFQTTSAVLGRLGMIPSATRVCKSVQDHQN